LQQLLRKILNKTVRHEIIRATPVVLMTSFGSPKGDWPISLAPSDSPATCNALDRPREETPPPGMVGSSITATPSS